MTDIEKIRSRSTKHKSTAFTTEKRRVHRKTRRAIKSTLYHAIANPEDAWDYYVNHKPDAYNID